VSKQGYRQVGVPPSNFPMHGRHICKHSIPAIVAAKVASLVRMFAVTAMVMAVDDAATCGRGSGKTCVARAMFAETMQDLYDVPCRSFRSPDA
jgi:hypothetical protein